MGYRGYLESEVKNSQVHSTEFYIFEYSASKAFFSFFFFSETRWYHSVIKGIIREGTKCKKANSTDSIITKEWDFRLYPPSQRYLLLPRSSFG